MKKFIVMMMVVACSLLGTNTIFAETLTVSSASGAPGTTVTLLVTLGDTTDGIAGASFTLDYDTTNLRLDVIRSNYFTTFADQEIEPDHVVIDTGSGTETYYSALVANVVNGTGTMLAAARVDNGGDPGEEPIFELDFEIADTAAPESTFNVQITQSTITNAAAGYEDPTPIPLLVAIDGTSYPARDVTLITAGTVTVSDGIVDSDGDGIDDQWERDNVPAGVDPDSPEALDVFTATGDYDKDGYTDLVEYQNDPTATVFNPTIKNAPGDNGYNSSTDQRLLKDFDGDAHSDILLRNLDGKIVTWLVSDNGKSIKNGNTLSSLPNTYTIADTGDFNGDGITDILLRFSDGKLYVWLVNEQGNGIIGSALLANLPLSYSIISTGDFDGDGYSDILLRLSDGKIYSWLMNQNGLSIKAGGLLSNLSTNYNVEGTSDFNGDGHADILLRHTDGKLIVWLMNSNGVSIQNGSQLSNLPLSFSVQKCGDFNGDGKSDILLRSTDGKLYTWLMNANGTSIVSGHLLSNLPTIYSIEELGDYDGDGKIDLLIRHSDGPLYSWIMNDTGTAIESGGTLSNLPISWLIQH